MLVSFTVGNWMSFRDRASISMLATKERQHRERVPRAARYRASILPIAAIYGGNASGKTSLFKALHFMQALVVHGTQPDARMPVQLFRLDAAQAARPVFMAAQILVSGAIYELTIVVTGDRVLEESLVEVLSASARTLYRRSADGIELGSALQRDERLRFAALGTRDNQLFLTNSVSQKREHFRPVYEWFRSSLVMVGPDARFAGHYAMAPGGTTMPGATGLALTGFDTGVARLALQSISMESLGLSDSTRSSLEQSVRPGLAAMIRGPGAERVLVAREEGGDLTARKLAAFHTAPDGVEVAFDLGEESDGTQRVIDLIPAFLELSAPGSVSVYVIDELDRSLHSLLTRRLVESYLGSCTPESRAQLVFSTHDVSLMDQALLRRDEMWVAERSAEGASAIWSFSGFRDVRYDKDVRRSYLLGRLGGVPQLSARMPSGASAVTEAGAGGGVPTEAQPN